MRIPKQLHIVWIGDESKQPRNLIKSWEKLNPTWQVVVWGNQKLEATKWINQKHINDMIHAKRLAGAADIMRYEILFHFGGFAVDADSQVCACLENQIVQPGLITNSFMASEANSALLAEMITNLQSMSSILDDLPWKVTGPTLLTETYQRLSYSNITLWPSHYFLPLHWTGHKYLGQGHVFGMQLWATTRGISDKLVML